MKSTFNGYIYRYEKEENKNKNKEKEKNYKEYKKIYIYTIWIVVTTMLYRT